jgi:Uma2 family endonuclease
MITAAGETAKLESEVLMSVASPQINPAVPEPAWEIAKIFPNQGHWSKWDYFLLPTNRLVELSNGNIELLEMATPRHQAMVGFLYEALVFFVRPRKLGNVKFAPLPMEIDEGTCREPDVLFMSEQHKSREHDEYWGAADLVMEVVSSDRGRDLEVKRGDYARAGVVEYWIVDHREHEITVLKLAGEMYESAGVYRSGEQAISAMLPDFAVDVAAVFAAK